MSDEIEPTTQTTDAAPEGAEQTTSTEPEKPNFGVEGIWNEDGWLDELPEVWAEKARDRISRSEAQLQKELQKRSARTPEIDADYLDLYKEAQAAGVPAAALEEAYNRSIDMAEQIREDPAGFLNSMQSEIQKQIDAGQLTLREGTKLMAQAEQAADDAAELDMSPADKRVADLEKRLQAREQAEQREHEQQTQQQQERQRQEFLKEAQAFTQAIDNAFLSNVADEQGKHATSVPARKAFATLAAQYADDAMNSGQPISNEEAIERALNDVGGWDTLRPKGRAGIPAGGGRGMPQPADVKDLPVEERMKAAVELAKSLYAS